LASSQQDYQRRVREQQRLKLREWNEQKKRLEQERKRQEEARKKGDSRNDRVAGNFKRQHGRYPRMGELPPGMRRR
jgi:hypothetical protein